MEFIEFFFLRSRDVFQDFSFAEHAYHIDVYY